MYSDSVLEELWSIKDANAKKYGYDVRRIAVALHEKQDQHGRRVVSFAGKELTPASEPPCVERDVP